MENKTIDFQNMSLFSLSNIEIAKYLDNYFDKELISKLDDDRLAMIIPYSEKYELLIYLKYYQQSFDYYYYF